MKVLLKISLVLVGLAFFFPLFAQDSASVARANGIVDIASQWPLGAKIAAFLAVFSELLSLIPNKYFGANGALDFVIKFIQAVSWKGGAKVLLPLLLMAGIATTTHAQSPFKPIPKVVSFHAANPFAKAVIAVKDSSVSAWRIVSVAAAYAEPGNILMAGVGYGFQHLSWDYNAEKWVCKWSVSPVAFAGGSVAPSTPASVMSIGILAGINNNLVMAGPIYNFGTKQFGVAVSVGINFNN